MRIAVSLSMVAVMALALMGCTSQTERELVVSAAASLADSFASMESAFEKANPDVDVVINLAGSSALREQILEGAPVDIFAPASLSDMDEVVAAGETVGEPRVFASNLLQIAVPSGNPSGVVGLGDFANEDLLIGLCVDGVPCGDLAREVLAKAGVVPSIDTSESDVRSLLTKIESGELDTGIVYVTDVVSSPGAVEGIGIPENINVAAKYPIGVMANGADHGSAAAFIEFVLSDEGQAIMAEFGFSSP